MITQLEGSFKQRGWFIKENDTGFWCYLDPNNNIQFKFPWKLYTYKIMEEV